MSFRIEYKFTCPKDFPLPSAVKQALKDLINQPSPDAKYYKNRSPKVIRVNYGFAVDNIPLKLIGEPSKWLELWDLYDGGNILLKTLESLLSKKTGRKTKEALSKYSEEWPDQFTGDVLSCVRAAILRHPKYPARIKKQGRSPIFNSDDERIEIISTARHLYVYIRLNMKKPKEQQPVPLDKLYKAYDLDEFDILQAVNATQAIIEKYFGLDLTSHLRDSSEGYFRFEKTFIYCLPLSHLNKSKRIKNGKSPFLAPIFAEIKD